LIKQYIGKKFEQTLFANIVRLEKAINFEYYI